jgi:hypothetical protein
MFSSVFVLSSCCQRIDGEPCTAEPETTQATRPISPEDGLSRLREPVSPQDEKYISGTVKYVGLEGGFWGIVADDGQKYDPVNLPKDYQKDGMKVKFRAQEIEDVASIHMWGKIIRILEIAEQ